MRGPTLGLSRCSVPASRPLLAQREVVGGGKAWICVRIETLIVVHAYLPFNALWPVLPEPVRFSLQFQLMVI